MSINELVISLCLPCVFTPCVISFCLSVFERLLLVAFLSLCSLKFVLWSMHVSILIRDKHLAFFFKIIIKYDDIKHKWGLKCPNALWGQFMSLFVDFVISISSQDSE